MWSILRCSLNRIQIPSFTKPCIRCYMKTSEKMELLLKQGDHVPFNYQLIYRHKSPRLPGIMYHTVNMMTCITIVSAGCYMYENGMKTRSNVPEVFKIFKNPFEVVVIAISTIAMVTFASVIRHRYVIRIYYNQQNKMYRGIFIGKIPFTVEHYDFPAACMTYVARNSAFPWRSTLFYANGRKIMMFDNNFKTQGDFYAMLMPEEIEMEN